MTNLANEFLTLAPRPASHEDAQELVAAALAFCRSDRQFAFIVPTAWFPLFAEHDPEVRVSIDSYATSPRLVEVRP
jgi:hypothetical protein